MNEHEAHALRVQQIEEVLPALLHPEAEGLTCLYVGATPWRFQLGEELHDAGYEITLLEVDKDNAYFYREHPWLAGGVIWADVRQLPVGRTWDVIVWWHGPEHISPDDLEPTLRTLETATRQLVVLAVPWGENLQPVVEANVHQEHKAHYQPGDLERLGYQTVTCGSQGDLSTWPHILAWKKIAQERVVYTAIFGDYDQLLPTRWPGRFVCFSDRPIAAVGWENVVMERIYIDPTREARMYKALAHQWFYEVHASLWIDGNCELLAPPSELFGLLDGVDIALPRHPISRALADEASLILQLGKARPDAVHRQMERYAQPDLDVGATGWLLRRHNDAIRALNEAWWSELSVHTLRDQLSLPYCLERLGIEARLIDVDLYDNALVRFHPHGRMS